MSPKKQYSFPKSSWFAYLKSRRPACLRVIKTGIITRAPRIRDLFSCAFCRIPVLGGFAVRRHRQQQAQEKIRALCAKLESALNDTADIRPPAVFADTLENAAVSTGFQQPRLKLQAGKPGSVPEKYKFFAGLVARGMSTDEISEVLAISPAEAGQLAALASISRGEGC